MPRLDIEKQKLLEPKRIGYAKEALIDMGFNISYEDKTRIEFVYKGEVIKFFPYSGWHSGKGIKDGRGLQKLLKQLK